MPPTYAELSLEELKRLLDAGEPIALLDVREPHEFQAGHIPSALSLPLGRVEHDAGARLGNRSTRVVLYCETGARSTRAAAMLAAMGYVHVATAKAGFSGWSGLGHPTTASASTLGAAARERYARQLQLPEVGDDGQKKLIQARVLVVGAGGLGSPASMYLTAAGIGRLGLVDADVVDASNLHRQVVHATSRIGQPKVASAATALRDLNPDVGIVEHAERLTSENVEHLIRAYDLVVDGTDNFRTRYLLCDASVKFGKPVVHASVHRFEGRVSTFVPEKAAERLGIASGPCYRCLFPEAPPSHLAPNCEHAGVLGVIPGVLGTLQATEAMKLVLGLGDLLVGRMLAFDAKKMIFREWKVGRREDCVACGDSPRMTP